MQTNLMEKDVENKRLSTSTTVSLSVAASASPSLISETSNANSILSKSPTPSSFSNYSNNGGKSDEKKKLKKAFHKFLNKTKLFNGNHTHSKKNSYSRSLNGDNNNYDKSAYEYSAQLNEKEIPNANANLNKNANTISTSRPASLLYADNRNNSSNTTLSNNYMTTPNGTSELPNQLKEEKDLKSLPSYCSFNYEQKLKSETERNMLSENLNYKEFAAEVGIPIREEDEDTDYYTNNSYVHNPSCSSCFTSNGIQSTYCSSKSYGPRLDMSIFEPPTERISESTKSIVTKYDGKNSNDTLNSKRNISLESMFDTKNTGGESVDIVDLENNSKEVNQKDDVKENSRLEVNSTRRTKGKKLSRFTVEVLNSNISKSRPTVDTNDFTGNGTSNNMGHGGSSGNFNLSTTYSLPNLNDLNKISRNGNGYYTTPSSPARRDYGMTMNNERSDNVYFNVGGCNNNQNRKSRRVSLSTYSPINSFEESKKNKLKINIDGLNAIEQNNATSSISSTSSVSPIHFEINHPTSSSSSLDIYNLNNNDTVCKGAIPSRDMTTTIITPEVNDNDESSINTFNTVTSRNSPSPEELKDIWIDKTLGGNTNHINKFHITNFQTEISKADKTIHTTTTSKIKDCMSNIDSVVFPIHIIKTPISSQCNTAVKGSKILNTTVFCNHDKEKGTNEVQGKEQTTLKKELNIKKYEKSSLSESANINNTFDENGKTEESKDSNEKSEDSSNVVQVIQKGRFTVMKEHHDYKHAVPHHYKFVIIKNPSNSNLLTQKDNEDGDSTGSVTSNSNALDSNKIKINGLDVDQGHKETLSTIITPTSSGLPSDQTLTVPSYNVSPPDSPMSSRSPSLSTVSIPQQQLANIAAASLSSTLNLSEGIAYTTTINNECSKCNESNKNEEHVLIVPTNDEKQNNLTYIQSFTSSTTPISSSLYISTITPVDPSHINELNNNKLVPGHTPSPLNSDNSTPSQSITNSPSGDLSSSSTPILFNKLSSSASTYRSISKSIIENHDRQFEPKLEPSHIVSASTPNLTKDNNKPSILNTTINRSTSSFLNESKPPLSPPNYPTLNSTKTLVNNSQILNQSSTLSEDLSVYTNYSDDTYIHINNSNSNNNSNENDMNIIKHNSKLSEEINNNHDYIRDQFLQHSETEVNRNEEQQNEYLLNLRKTQSVKYPEQIKPYNYSYDSLDRNGSYSTFEPLEIEEEEEENEKEKEKNELLKSKLFRPGPDTIEVSQGKIDREVVTSPFYPKDPINIKKKYFPTHSCDQVSQPLPDYERKDSYYDYDNSNEQSLPNIEKQFSEMSTPSLEESSLHSQSINGFERSRAYSMGSMRTNDSASKNNPLGSTIIGRESNKSISTNDIPVHPHHHHHFFIISNSEADIPTSSSPLKRSNDYKDSNSSTRVVISKQHRKFDITTTSSKSSLISSTNSNSTTNLIHHKRTPSNSSNYSTHSSRFIVTRESSKSNNVNNSDKSPLSSATSITPKKQSRFTVTRQAIN
ncbi:hypothetical protein LY90DRAFT_7284 [Neocallimastix californiae]|jgi:hypothetical protein|uniref:Uncharacterized protein n=1 Tax=Neocallimastix californiae TaxID=1754190 RepID=A0A1Y2CPU4_9FUNG|nr:hypothetical protein LY90DRAFT_7284 [Neocallimastix californiae]|eukprot:ORY48365.1 hypothetical protein LY90DRAFT_7284 [Neocallimastix californiae]